MRQLSCNNPISVLDSGEIFPLSRTILHILLPIRHCPLPILRALCAPLSHFIKLRRSFFTISILQKTVQRRKRFQPCFVGEEQTFGRRMIRERESRFKGSEVGLLYFMEQCGNDQQRAQHLYLFPSLPAKFRVLSGNA